MSKKKNKTTIKQKGANFVKNRALNFMKKLTSDVGNEIFTELQTLREKMNISIDMLLDDNKDVDSFYNLVTSYYNSYMKGDN